MLHLKRTQKAVFICLITSALLTMSTTARSENAPTVSSTTSSATDINITVPDTNSPSPIVVHSVDEMRLVMKQVVYNRQPSVSINFLGSLSTLLTEISSINTGDDYLDNCVSDFNYALTGYDGNVKLDLQLNYISTKTQEEYVSSKVTEILTNILTPYMSDDQKEKAIHDYIVTHVDYDYTLAQRSTYAALFDGKAVCQGYALLAYKMLNQAGVKTRIVTGYAYDGVDWVEHAWDLVQLDNQWYHVDPTWDDSVTGSINYNYYNLSDAALRKDHTWYLSKFPTALVKYDFSIINKPRVSAQSIINDKPWASKYSNYKEMGSLINVPVSKQFTASFSAGVNVSTVNSSNIQLINANMGTSTDIDIKMLSDRKVAITPKSPLISGDAYYIVVKNGIKSTDNIKNLSQYTICGITVQ